MGFAVGMGRRRARRLGQSLWLRQKEIRLDSYRLRAGESIRGNSCALRTDKVRVRIEPDGATMQEDTISGSFSANKESDLSVSARQSALLLSWVSRRLDQLCMVLALRRFARADHCRINYVCSYRICDQRVAWATALHIAAGEPGKPSSPVTLFLSLPARTASDNRH